MLLSFALLLADHGADYDTGRVSSNHVSCHGSLGHGLGSCVLHRLDFGVVFDWLVLVVSHP